MRLSVFLCCLLAGCTSHHLWQRTASTVMDGMWGDYCWFNQPGHRPMEAGCLDKQAQPALDRCISTLAAQRPSILEARNRTAVLECMARDGWYPAASITVID